MIQIQLAILLERACHNSEHIKPSTRALIRGTCGRAPDAVILDQTSTLYPWLLSICESCDDEADTTVHTHTISIAQTIARVLAVAELKGGERCVRGLLDSCVDSKEEKVSALRMGVLGGVVRAVAEGIEECERGEMDGVMVPDEWSEHLDEVRML